MLSSPCGPTFKISLDTLLNLIENTLLTTEKRLKVFRENSVEASYFSSYIASLNLLKILVEEEQKEGVVLKEICFDWLNSVLHNSVCYTVENNYKERNRSELS